MIKIITISIIVSCSFFAQAQSDTHQQQVDLLIQQKSHLKKIDLDQLQNEQADETKKVECSTCPLQSKTTNQINHTQNIKTVKQWIDDKSKIERILIQMKEELPSNAETYGKYLQSLRVIEQRIQQLKSADKTSQNTNESSKKKNPLPHSSKSNQ